MHFTMKYLKRLPVYEHVQPYKIHGHPGLAPWEETNCIYEEIDNIVAQDIRDCKDKPRFEREGFEVIWSPSRVTLSAATFENDSLESNAVIAAYLEETIHLVRGELGASLVVVIDWRVGRVTGMFNASSVDNFPVPQKRFRSIGRKTRSWGHQEAGHIGGDYGTYR